MNKACQMSMLTCSSENGGTRRPKHFGQSGQPIPEPVTLTKIPAKITRNIDIRVTSDNLLKDKEWNLEK